MAENIENNGCPRRDSAEHGKRFITNRIVKLKLL